MHYVAHSRTRNTLAANRTIKSAGGLNVYGIVVSSSSATVRTVTFVDTDANIYLDVVIGTDATETVDLSWLADNGLSVNIDSVDSDVKFTVFHDNLAGTS